MLNPHPSANRHGSSLSPWWRSRRAFRASQISCPWERPSWFARPSAGQLVNGPGDRRVVRLARIQGLFLTFYIDQAAHKYRREALLRLSYEALT